jgi:Kef-type K+ transport system membrane component KefB
MIELGILSDLAVVIVGATAVLLALRPLGVPPILAYILAGLLLGPLLGLLAVTETLDLFSELGVALLLFVVGLELSIGRIRDVGRPAALAGTLQVGITFVLGTLIALALGFDARAAAFLGLATTFSSTVVVVKLLDRAGEFGTLHGRVAIGILLVQDVLVAVVLTLVAGMGDRGDVAIGPALARAFIGLLAMTAVAAVFARWILPPLFSWLAQSTEALFIASLTWAFGFIVAAEMLHVSVELGAFVAGVAIAQLPYNDELRHRVHPLVDFFLAVFFVSLGASMDPGGSVGYVPAILVLSLFVLVGKPLIVAWLLTRVGYGGRSAFLSGVTLGQVSEFAFILVAAAAAAGLVEDELLSLVGVVGLVTIGGSSLLVPRASRLFERLLRTRVPSFLRRDGHDDEHTIERSGHVIVIGMNTLGRLLVHRLAEMGEDVVAVDSDPAKLHGLPAEALAGSVGSPALLDQAGIARAKLVVSALRIEDVNSMLAYRCSEASVPVSIHAFDPSLADELFEIGADHVMISKLDGIAQMRGELRRLKVTR